MTKDSWSARLGSESRLWFSLGDSQEAFDEALARVRADDVAARLWAREGALWQKDVVAIAGIENRLGWLALPQFMPIETTRLKALAAEVRAAGLEWVVLLGMGGSSLAPETMRLVFGATEGYCDLVVLDTTDPAQIRRTMQTRPIEDTLFLVASKSGSTAETLNLYHYFAVQAQQIVGEEWARHFVAITDPGSALDELGTKVEFRAVYQNSPDIGGRYSALSLFGLVPAALIGVDLGVLLARARQMSALCGALRSSDDNPGLVLGTIIGALAQSQGRKRDKLTLVASPEVQPFVPWVEQLIAESTGKSGVGVLPVEDEGAAVESLGADRLYAYLRLDGSDNSETDARIEQLLARGFPVVALGLRDRHDLGAEFFRWEFATAVAGQVLGINPFDQPDVESAKIQARTALVHYEQTRTLSVEEPVVSADGISIYGRAPAADETGEEYLRAFLRQAGQGDYVALVAYIDRSPENEAQLVTLRRALAERLGRAVTVGFGPRFLHSTGQLHKGGPNTGLFVQITYEDSDDLEIPGRSYTFGVLQMAQALGDLEALRKHERRVTRVHLVGDIREELLKLSSLMMTAL